MPASQAANYQIVVEGSLDPTWCECLGGLSINEVREPGQPTITHLTGRLVDQSALQGVLDTLFMLQVRLLSVEFMPAEN
jgi:hypothetical protein